MAAKSSAVTRRVALFVEGTSLPTPSRRNDLQELWRHLGERVSQFPRDQLDVYGFSKQQIIIMHPKHAAMPGAGKIPLDVAIDLRYRERPFQGLVVAFDAYPANQAIEIVRGAPCLRLERDFVLRQFAASRLLPPQFRAGARSLLTHYRRALGQARDATRPPLGDVEIIYMDPMFEALVLQDAAALRGVFGLSRTPNDWPALPYSDSRPDFALGKIVNEHRKDGPKHLRLPYAAAKHSWAHEVLRHAPPTSAIWSHVIASRLAKLLV